MYSQNDEEKHILEHAPPFGLVVDIGAFDGITRSNSRALIERGWRALLIEPSPIPFRKLLEVYNDNPKVLLANFAVTCGNHHLERIRFNDGELSTCNDSFYDAWRERAYFFRDCLIHPVYVGHLCGSIEMKDADVISVDTEGSSEEIFFELIFRGIKPKVWVVEAVSNRKIVVGSSAQIYRLVYESPENVVLVRKD